MNELVRKIIPVAELPAELQVDFDPNGQVEIVGAAAKQSGGARDLLERVREYRSKRRPRFNSPDDVVAYVRAVRDGGDLEPWLGPCSTSTRTS